MKPPNRLCHGQFQNAPWPVPVHAMLGKNMHICTEPCVDIQFYNQQLVMHAKNLKKPLNF